ncbi:MAG: hypothetical protein IPK03_12920 [Bacteroidetes bacterium]|nr:hypothetical protein [Bacteroidota bacterium]
MEIVDLFLAPTYLLFIFFFAIVYRSKALKGANISKFFLPGLALKCFGAIVAGLIYKFYYGTGDTFTYYTASKYLNEIINVNFDHWWSAITNSSQGNIASTYLDIRVIQYDKTFFFVKMCSWLGLISFNNYTVIALFLAVFSFATSWKFYKMCCDLYPKMWKTMGYIVFYIPSVIFWGSGLFKDTITYGSILLLTASFYFAFHKKDRVVYHLFLMLMSAYFLQNIREFLLITILPPLIIWYVLQFKNVIRSAKVRFLIGPVFAIVGIAGGTLVISSLTSSDEQLKTQNLKDKSKGFQQWHSSEGAGGSSYTLGDMDYTNIGIIKKIPAAINVTLFRPYLFEVRNPVMLIAGIESLFFLFLTLGVIKEVKFGVFLYFFDNANVFFFLLFSLVFAFVAGFNSYNFGALVRYKIPCMPYFLIGIYIMKYEILQTKERRMNERRIAIEEEEKRLNAQLSPIAQ